MGRVKKGAAREALAPLVQTHLNLAKLHYHNNVLHLELLSHIVSMQNQAKKL